MIEAEEALSKRARASTVVPSGALTSNQHIMSNEFDLRPMVVLEEMMSICRVTVTGVELTL